MTVGNVLIHSASGLLDFLLYGDIRIDVHIGFDLTLLNRPLDWYSSINLYGRFIDDEIRVPLFRFRIRRIRLHRIWHIFEFLNDLVHLIHIDITWRCSLLLLSDKPMAKDAIAIVKDLFDHIIIRLRDPAQSDSCTLSNVQN